MYFWFFKLKKWGKKTAETRRRNCAVLPKDNYTIKGGKTMDSGSGNIPGRSSFGPADMAAPAL